MTSTRRKIVYYVILYVVFVSLIIYFLNKSILDNFKNAFLPLFSRPSSFWFIFKESPGQVPPGGGSTTPYPDPPWTEVPIATKIYWGTIFTSLFRTIVIALILIVVINIILFVMRKFDYISRKQNTVPYLIYTKTIRRPVRFIKAKIDSFFFVVISMLVHKKNAIAMILVFFLVSGLLPLLFSNLIQSIFALFKHSPGVWLLLHIKALLYYLFLFVKSFRVINIIAVVIITYLVIAFTLGYAAKAKHDSDLEKEIAAAPIGVNVSAQSGQGKTASMVAFAGASQRNTKEMAKEWIKDTKFAYSKYMNFRHFEYAFDVNKKRIQNSLNAEDFAKKYIEENNIKNRQMDRFKGETPDLYDRLKWYSIALWLLKEPSLVISNVPMIIHDPSTSDEVRVTIGDLLTNRRKVNYAKKLDMTVFSEVIKGLIGKIDGNGKLQITAEEERTAKMQFGHANFSLEPGLTIIIDEADKDFHNSNRSEILKEGVDKFFAVIRHFVSFDQKTFSHVFFAAQQDNGVAMVVRGRFDTNMNLMNKQSKQSLLFKPFILFIDYRIRFWARLLEVSSKLSPYKNSLLREFFLWRLRRLKRYSDYFDSFSYWKIHAQYLDSKGVTKTGQKSFVYRLNLSEIFYQYNSTPYQQPYQYTKRNYSKTKFEDLKQYRGNDLDLNDLMDIKSEFLYGLFGVQSKPDKKKEDKDKAKEAQDNFDLLD